MACFVTGIVPTNDVSEVEKLLDAVPGIDHSKLSVITSSARTGEHDDSFVNFVHAAGDATIMTGSGGTSVPGINRDPSGMGLLGHPHVVNALGVLPIPEDELENYNDALEDGRCVIAYECSDGAAAAMEGAMQQAGVRRVKTFKG